MCVLMPTNKPDTAHTHIHTKIQPVLTVVCWNFRLMSRYVCVKKRKKQKYQKKGERVIPSSWSAVCESCSEEEKESLWCVCMCVCSCGSFGFNATEDEPAPGNPSSAGLLCTGDVTFQNKSPAWGKPCVIMYEGVKAPCSSWRVPGATQEIRWTTSIYYSPAYLLFMVNSKARE